MRGIVLDKKEEDSSLPALVENITEETRREIKSHWAIAALLLFCALSGFFGSWIAFRVEVLQGTRQNIDNSTEVIVQEGEVIASVAEELKNSVVSIQVETQTQGFFSQAQLQQSAGSGIILTADGLVVTNKHVIPETASQVSVIMSDGTEYENVEVIGKHTFTDIAFLQIADVSNLTPAKLGDSTTIRVGEKVIAIGNALGRFDNSVTLGIVSGKGRPLTASGFDGDAESLQNLIQTDAAINPGNSGGPLVNVYGEVIGINTAIASDAQNIGFAIPIDDVKSSIQSVEENGRLIKPYLGVRYVTITPDLAEQLELSSDSGAYIQSFDGSPAILRGSPADKAGLQSGDIITAVNGTEIDANNPLVTLVSKSAVGQTVTLSILRGDQQLDIPVVLEEVPSGSL